ncbi:MAG: hypothetical protein K0R38_4063 [Polyangiaceae bacterium]|jgi:hypothetical protein|nr:hypothetical protein [Polyangiaceae bacterium]
MNRRTMGLGVFAGITFAVTGLLAGCGSGGGSAEEHGTLRVPLSTQGPSGTSYRLRDATFEIRNQYYYYSNAGGEGGVGSTPQVVTVSSESDPNASSISVSRERGYYYVRLLPGWRMEKVEGGVATDVEATLLSNENQGVYVNAHSTSWIEYQFGIGDRALWFNGDLNLQIQVYEDPSDLYGYSGEHGGGGFSGSPGGFSGSP